MSLRLRDGPRGVNRHPNSDDDSSTLLTKGKLDGILDSVLEQDSNTTDKSREDEHLDTWTISDDIKSKADDSTAVSSVNWLPLPTPAQIRASAPRALTGISKLPQDIAPATATPSSKPADKNSKDNKQEEEDVVTLGTIDQNRPIDQVFVYSSSNASTAASGSARFPPITSLSSHRQRRHYRSGHRSQTSSVASRGSFRGSSAVGGILDSLGLTAETSEHPGESVYAASTTSSSKQKGFSNRRRHALHANSNTQGAVYARAGLVLLLLMTILYIQWNALEQQQDFAGHFHHRAYHQRAGMHEEGMDRPMHDSRLQKTVQHDPSDVALRNAKVPTERDGPEHLVDRPKLQLLDKKDSNEKAAAAPVDALPAQPDTDETDKVTIPFEIQTGFAGTYTKDKNHENIPFLWFIPRSGAGMIKNICSQCMGMTLANEVGGTIPKPQGEKLQVVSVGGHKYVNVDTTTQHGITEAKSLGLASSGLVQLVVSPRFRDSASLFDASKKGRAIAFLRHPVERAVSMFHFLKQHNVPAVAQLTVEEYAKSPHVENNWMVRILSGKMEGEVGESELAVAKEVLRTKVVVGLMERKEESLQRFAYYFDWPSSNDPGKQSACQSRILVGDYRTNESAKAKVKEASQAWSLLLWQNKLDMKLYKYAKALFLQQGAELFADMPQG